MTLHCIKAMTPCCCNDCRINSCTTICYCCYTARNSCTIPLLEIKISFISLSRRQWQQHANPHFWCQLLAWGPVNQKFIKLKMSLLCPWHQSWASTGSLNIAVTALLMSCNMPPQEDSRGAKDHCRGTLAGFSDSQLQSKSPKIPTESINTSSSVLMVYAEPGNAPVSSPHTRTHTPTETDKPSCKAPFTSRCPPKDNIFCIHHTSLPPECKIDSWAGRPLNLMDEQLTAPLCIMWCW